MNIKMPGTIKIIDSFGGSISIKYKPETLKDISLLEQAKNIVAALGDDWNIYTNQEDSLSLTIGPEKKLLDNAITSFTDTWLTTVKIEEKYKLAKGSVRRDIHRKKFSQDELKKVGRDWTIKSDAADRLYNKK
ncbi:hypothetical protein [uncultured Clostridium sp.]|uniref:hypothetical protein n=1 Tax=uncultured Clostridium sp. TaxID=59620 RepID=UPI0028E61B2F|nr:hypothetical protein [uncultured Clostridium sp.]